MNKYDSSNDQCLKKLIDISDQFFRAFSKETDRALGVISAIYLDNLLENLIRAAYIKSPKISSLFKSSQLLQPFNNKIMIAYFSGLIPEPVYHDLRLICEIRNKFAHEIIADLKFTDGMISNKIDRFVQLPPNVLNIYSPRLKFLLIITHVGSFLRTCVELLSEIKPPNCVEFFKFDKLNFQDMILTPSEIGAIITGMETGRTENIED